jgi:hypothetical protein
MKHLGFLFLLINFVSVVVIAQGEMSKFQKKESKIEITFEKTIYDFGKIEYNGNGTYCFKFENSGEKPIYLIKVKSVCGCTIPSWPKEPIKPGAKGIIKVEYNTRIVGSFLKSIRVYSNADNSPILLTIKGIVEYKE